MGIQTLNMLVQSLVLVVMAQAASAAATDLHCSALCQASPSPLQCATICIDLQKFTTQCGFPGRTDNLRALAASTDPLSYAATILKDLSGGHTLGPGTGGYDLCHAIPTAQYCISQLQVPLGGKIRTVTNMATCVNSLTCSSTAVSDIWSTAISLAGIASGAGANTSKLPLSVLTTCGDQSYDWEAGSYVWIVVCIALVLVTLVCTVLSVTAAEPPAYIVNLALTTHWQAFVSSRPAKIVTGCMDGIRWMSMCWVVMGHSLLWPLQLGVPYLNQDDVIPAPNVNDIPLHDPVSARFSGQAIQAAEFSVDSFFFMSGFLAVFIGLKKIESLSSLSVLIQAPMMVLDRFLRLTPTYMLVLFALTYIVPLTSHGPYWETANQPVIDACKE